MTFRSRRCPGPALILALVVLTAAVTTFSCRSTIDLVLDDPTFRDDMVQDALEGRKFRIKSEDLPEIARLLSDGNPDYRRAGVILAIQDGDESFRLLIVKAALDSDTAVSGAAMVDIERRPQVYRQAVLALLDEKDPSLRAGGLRLLPLVGGDGIVGILIGHFADTDPNVRNQASLSVRAITDRNNPELRAALRSTDSRTAAMAYRTLGRYADPSDTPLFIEAFSSSDQEVRKEAQLAVLRMGGAGLPFLHLVAADQTKAYRVRISALEVIQGLRSADSLPLLLELLDDPDRRVSEKALTILGTYGADAIPRLTEVYAVSGDIERVRIIRLMGDIRSTAALSTLSEALDSPSDEVRLAAMNAIRLFGAESKAVLRGRIANGSPRSRSASITLLRELGDPWLVTLEDGNTNQQALLLLITYSSTKELSGYLAAAGIPRLSKETVMSLKEAWDLSIEFLDLVKTMSGNSQPYLRAWRQWESYALAARQALQQSFDELHKYFETRDLGLLETARKARAESRRMDGLAAAQKKIIGNMSDAEKAAGEVGLARYREIRETLVRIWESTGPKFKGVAEAVFIARGLDPQILSQESTLLE